MLEIFLDGDACPVKDEAARVARRHGLAVHIVSNGGLRPSRNPEFHHVTVAAGADAADDWIAEHVGAGDIAITSDLPLAARCLAKGAVVLSAKGEEIGEERIGMALALAMEGINPLNASKNFCRTSSAVMVARVLSEVNAKSAFWLTFCSRSSAVFFASFSSFPTNGIRWLTTLS